MAEEKKERDYSIVAAIVLVGVPVVVFFALDYTVLPYWKSGTVEEAQLISTPDGERLFVVENVNDGEDSTLERMKVFDPSDLTKEPLQTYTRSGVSYRGYAGGRLWFSSDDDDLGWHARDPRTLEVTVTEPQLVKADARLAKVHQGSFTGDGLDLDTLDGYELHVDAETLAITDAPKNRPSTSLPSLESYDATLDETRELAFEGQPRRSVTLNKVVQGTETFLEPRFLRPRRSDANVFVVGDPESVIVLHRKTVKYDSPISISRVTTDGRVLWTRGLGDENRLEEAALSGDFLVVVTHNTIRSIFLKDGSVAAVVEL